MLHRLRTAMARLPCVALRCVALLCFACSQMLGKLPLDVDDLGIDLMSMSSHKVRASERAGARASERATERASDGASERLSEREVRRWSRRA